MEASDSEEELDLPDGPAATNIPPTIYVLKFHPNTRTEAIEWLLEKIEARQKYGGAELFVRSEPQKIGQGVTVHISATKIKLLEIAEATEIQKKTSSGLIQEFSVKDLDQFLYGGQTLDTILTPSEREFCVRHELDAIRAKSEESTIFGYPEFKLFPGQSIIDAYRDEDLITGLFPLHDRNALGDLSKRWFTSLIESCSLDDIRSYFGESVAMYFSFVTFYTLMLAVPAILGAAHFFLSVDPLSEYAIFAAIYIFWVIVTLELWKRRSTELSYSWGTLGKSKNSETRPNYRGDMIRNQITGRFEPYYPEWKTNCKTVFASLPIVVVCMFLSLWVMKIAFVAEEQLIDMRKKYGFIAGFFGHFPSAVYAVVVWIINFYFKKLAQILTEWENHRTKEEHDWNQITKLVAFQFVNNFSSLFYIAYYIQDFDMLRSQVATLLIVNLMINHFRDSLLPIVVRKAYLEFSDKVMEQVKAHPWMKQFYEENIRTVHLGSPEDQPVPVLSLDPKDPRIDQAKEEANLYPYSDNFDDYLEMFIQFGYIFMFSSVYPTAAFWVVLNNILQLKADSIKLCRIYQRPRSKKATGIGVWQSVFEMMGLIAVITNSALLWLSPRIRPLSKGASEVQWVLIFVAIEHAALLFKYVFMRSFSETPGWVRYALDKVAYQSRLAYKNERVKKTRRHLSRRFRSVHGMPRSGSRSRATTPIAQNGGIRRRSSPHTDY